MLRRGFLSTILATLAACAGPGSGGAPPGAIAQLLGHDPASVLRPDHRPWDELLKRYHRLRSDRVALFPYGAVSQAEQEVLDAYLNGLASYPVTLLNRRAQYAYWLNLHNALLLRLVMQRYMLSSVRDLDRLGDGNSPLGPGPWGFDVIRVDGVPLSLWDIRERILRPVWRDPRLHYGLFLAAIGGPNLQARAFEGAIIDRQLEDAALEFVNHPRAVRMQQGRLVLSSLYTWYADDFGGQHQALLGHLRMYARPGIDPLLVLGVPVAFEFDWSLNDATGLRN